MIDWSKALIHLNGSGFTDGADRHVKCLDIVEYRFGARRGILLEAMHDGNAFVLFRDTKTIEVVKWHHLCKVTAIDEYNELSCDEQFRVAAKIAGNVGYVLTAEPAINAALTPAERAEKP